MKCSDIQLKYHQQSKNYEKSLKYLNMGFTGMFSVETILKIIGFGVKVGSQLPVGWDTCQKNKNI